MEPFLKKLANHISENYQDNIGDICIILPNKRAKVFLMKYLANLLDSPSWTPEVFSIEDFVLDISGLQLAEPLDLITQLYKAYKSEEKKDAESFDEFLQWGFILLGDFDEIDLNLVPADKVFNYLSDAKAIAQWDPEGKKLTDFQKKYLQFYRALNNYYNNFIHLVESTNQVHRGYAYKKACDELEKKDIQWDKVIFAGFNALTKSELRIIELLKNRGKVDLLWDIDEYYLNDKAQEAGQFFREYKKKFSKLNWIETNFKQKKNIRIYGAAKNVNQAKLAGNVLKNFYKEQEDENPQLTALVLADENLLMPVLNSIPDEVKSVNVTMGYSLKNSLQYDFYDKILELYENASRLEDIRPEQGGRFYYKDILQIINHQVVASFFESNEVIQETTHNIIASNRVFWNLEDIKKYALKGLDTTSLSFVEQIFSDINKDVSQLVKSVLLLTQEIKDSFVVEDNNSKEHTLNIEFLYAFYVIFNRLHDFLSSEEGNIQISSVRKLFKQVARQSKLPFEGEPLQGLQVMGVLETRSIDFENVVLVSANEGILPFGKGQSSFIPLDILREFGMPVYSDKDAVYAYHFYRMLQKAKNIYLIYNTESGAVGANEKSRFISQLQYELPLYNPEVEISESVETLDILEIKPPREIIVRKTADILKKIQAIGEHGFSPTTLINYINCSLKFYFEKIAKLKDNEELEETIEANTLGTVAHEILQSFYEPLINKNVTVEDIKGFLKEVGNVTDSKFKEFYKNGQLKYGKNLLLAKVVKKFIQNYLKNEIKELQKGNNLIIKDVEKKYESFIAIDSGMGDDQLNVKINGTADRIDIENNVLRIIDYKTGNVDKKELDFKEWENLIENKKFNKSFQLLTYAYLFFKNNPTSNYLLESGIVSFRNLGAGLLKLQLPAETNYIAKNDMDEFENILQVIIERIFDRDLAFSQTKDFDICKFCNFKTICNR